FLRKAWLLTISRWKTRKCTVVGRWNRIEGRLIVANGGEIHLGGRVCIRAIHVAVELASFPGGKLEIGARTFINSGVSICAQQSVKIGKSCAIGNYSLIMDTDFHSLGDINTCP